MSRESRRDRTARRAPKRRRAGARTLAQREFERPVVVEAGAGTGKTTALVARVLAWSFGPGWDRAKALAASTTEGARDDRIAAQVLRGVVAITFTEKAAAEMSERIGDALLEVERGNRLDGWRIPYPTLRADELCERARALRGSLDHLVVQTIHAYCRRLLVENSLDARLHPNLEIDADGRLQEQAVRSAMEASARDRLHEFGRSRLPRARRARNWTARDRASSDRTVGCWVPLGSATRGSRDARSHLCADRRLREQLDDYAAIAGGDLSERRQRHYRHSEISRCAARDIERGAAFGSSWLRAIRRSRFASV